MRLSLALLLLAWPALTLASQAWEAGGPACARPEAPRTCACQTGPEADGSAGCGCCAGTPCQVDTFPPSAQDESLPNQAWQPDSAGQGLDYAADQGATWSPLPRAAEGAPWRPPKPLYLHLRSLLI